MKSNLIEVENHDEFAELDLGAVSTSTHGVRPGDLEEWDPATQSFIAYDGM